MFIAINDVTGHDHHQLYTEGSRHYRQISGKWFLTPYSVIVGDKINTLICNTRAKYNQNTLCTHTPS